MPIVEIFDYKKEDILRLALVRLLLEMFRELDITLDTCVIYLHAASIYLVTVNNCIGQSDTTHIKNQKLDS